MARRPWLLALLLIVGTACPHAWGRRGTIERALEQDMNEYYSQPGCPLDEYEYEDFCVILKDPTQCPPECRSRRDWP